MHVAKNPVPRQIQQVPSIYLEIIPPAATMKQQASIPLARAQTLPRAEIKAPITPLQQPQTPLQAGAIPGVFSARGQKPIVTELALLYYNKTPNITTVLL